jgi:diacylglycerol kinase family enzyme
MDVDVSVVKGAEITGAARQFAVSNARAASPSILVVGGGDGTVGAAASALAGTDILLGILPLGTLNHFAKDLNIPTDLDAAMDIIAAARARAVDVGEVNGRVFLNNSSIGVYPFLVVERTAEQRRRGVGKLIASIPAIVRTVRALSWQRLTISAEGSRRELRTPCVFVGNNFYDLSALGSRGKLSSAELCLYVVKRQSWVGLALLPIKVAFGLTDPARDVELFRVPSVELRAWRKRVLISLDGEAVEEVSPLQYRIRPQALRVIVPEIFSDDEVGPTQ